MPIRHSGTPMHGNLTKRGENFQAWMDGWIFNRGDSTQNSRKEGGKSRASDLSIAQFSKLDKLSWRTVMDLGSDHITIIITYNNHIQRIKVKPKYKWKLKDANWEGFTKMVDNSIKASKDYRRKSVRKLEKIVRETIIKAANKHIGMKRVDCEKKATTSPEIKAAIQERNKLRKTLPRNRQQWREACKQVNKLIEEKKSQDWMDFVDTLDRTTDPRKVWSTIRAIDGRATVRDTNEVLEIDGDCFITDKDKADQFARTYKGFSKIPTRKDDRRVRKDYWRRMSAPHVKEECEQEFTMVELERAIAAASNCKAAGDDKIPYEMIKKLGPAAKELLLHLYNLIWSGQDIPTRWRRQLIKPLLKDGKDRVVQTNLSYIMPRQNNGENGG